jgi:hypothetical protein
MQFPFKYFLPKFKRGGRKQAQRWIDKGWAFSGVEIKSNKRNKLVQKVRIAHFEISISFLKPFRVHRRRLSMLLLMRGLQKEEFSIHTYLVKFTSDQNFLICLLVQSTDLGYSKKVEHYLSLLSTPRFECVRDGISK